MPDEGLGALTAALARAQAAFPPIPRDKEVTVTSARTGGKYTFKYAPLDTILAAVRKPLADNGLAIAQLLNGDELVTLLLHQDGGQLEGHITLPPGDTVQALGSSITYLRRYAIQALLAIAAEEDDDGNRASGNQVAAPEPASGQESEGGLIGVASLGKAAPVDGEPREGPQGRSVGFVLGEGREKVQVVAWDKLADDILAVLPLIIGQRVQVYGPVSYETMRVGKYDRRFPRLTLVQIKTDDFILPATVASPLDAIAGTEAEQASLFDEAAAKALT